MLKRKLEGPVQKLLQNAKTTKFMLMRKDKVTL